MPEERQMWIDRMLRVVRPVLQNLAAGTLRKNMPVEHHATMTDRPDYTYLEALGRTACGVAPWLALAGESLGDAERKAHAECRKWFADAVASGVSPDSPDRVNFDTGQQPIVDAAFLAHAVIRAPAVFHALPEKVQADLVAALTATRTRKPGANNWLLFAAMVETALYALTGQCDLMRIDYAVRQHEQWYLGGGVYGDGPLYHADYYNSFVIQPMLIDVLRTVAHLDPGWTALLPKVIERGQRFAQIQERSVAPDGSFPPTGRSIAYRCGAFQHLAQMALQHALPGNLPPAQVRGVLGSLIARTLDAPNTFDANGWLQIGLSGAQPSLGETYISTGSLYLCSAVFLPLGLPPDDAFWAGEAVESTWQKAWGGKDLMADKG